MLTELNHKIINGQELVAEEATALMLELLDPVANPQQISEALLSLNSRLPSPDELVAYVNVLEQHSRKCNFADYEHFDLCGTGGDGKNSINISTLASFVIAAMGEKLAKHGNYAASSKFGSSNLLEGLGVPLYTDLAKIEYAFADSGVVFLHAPFMHPALKGIAPIRKALGVRTIFNLMGPLLNPSKPKFQVIGAVGIEIAQLLAKVLNKISQGRELFFCTLADSSGYDEASLISDCKVFSLNGTSLSNAEVISAETFGISPISEEAIAAPQQLDSLVELSTQILKGYGTPAQNHVICANVALALKLRYQARSLESLFKDALSAISSGEPFAVLEKIRSLK
jgi:anthranilate phosphoribosyltransferase